MQTRLRSSKPPRSRAVLVSMALGSAALTACDGEPPDAYGNFESREVMVASQVTGPLVRFDLEEGDEVEVDAVVAQVDTVALGLQATELALQAQAARTRAEEARAQVRALEAQLGTNRTDLERTQRLFAQNAATAGDLNRMEGAVTTLTEQIDGARARVRLADQDGAIVASRLEQLRDRIARATVHNPIRGTVLTTMVEAGEFVQAGRALYAVAPLDTLILRAYVSGGQLGSLRVGEEVTVQFDGGAGELERRPGRLTWIASEAEFTPTPIQTREERVDQVYAVKVLVPNLDGSLKIGMPGELLLTRADPGGAS
jgi:HlyD family secretion protein